MARFFLTPSDDLLWTVRDNETGVSIEFREGLFNDTQEITTSNGMTTAQVAALPTTMREIGDWMAQNHYDVAMCHYRDRAEALWMLAREEYWITMATAMMSLVIDFDRDQASEHLYAEVEDYLSSEDDACTAMTVHNLLGSLSMLTNGQAWEVINIIYTYWHYKADTIDIQNWARDILWWPAWCPLDLLDADDNENEED